MERNDVADERSSTGEPLVSVITPSYNHAAYISETIESVLGQDYPAVEHIVVDGGSTDGTVGILRAYAERYPDRFRWVSEPDEGQSDAFNKGLELAHGTFIGWQNSDDYYYPNVFAEPIRHLIAHPDVAVVFSECQFVDEAGRVLGEWPAVGPFDYARLLEIDYIPNQATFVRRDALLACGGLVKTLHYTMDYDLWLRLGLMHRIIYMPGVRGAMRVLPTAKTQANYYRNLQEQIATVENALHDRLFPPQFRQRGHTSLLHRIFDAIVEALLRGYDDDVAGLMQHLLRYDPALSQWAYFIERLLNLSAGYDDHGVDATIPMRAVTMLEQAGLAQTPYRHQLIALTHLYRSSQSRHLHLRRATVSQAAHALTYDRWWLRHRIPQLMLLRLLLGPRTLSCIRIVARSFRLIYRNVVLRVLVD